MKYVGEGKAEMEMKWKIEECEITENKNREAGRELYNTRMNIALNSE